LRTVDARQPDRSAYRLVHSQVIAFAASARITFNHRESRARVRYSISKLR
jgi:hypothetical protein